MSRFAGVSRHNHNPGRGTIIMTTARVSTALLGFAFGLLLPVGQGHAAECGTSGNIYWSVYSGAVTPMECAADARSVYWVLGTTVSCRGKDSGTELWNRDLLTTVQRPVPIATRDGIARIIGATGSGFVYSLDAANGTTQWSRNTRRTSCSSDQVTSTPCVQLWAPSNAAFQGAINTDLVIVGTHYGCGTTTANKIYAINGNDGSVRWIFNSTGTYQQDAFTGLTLDYTRNRVYGTMDKAQQLGQNTLVAVSTTNGSRVWSQDLGAILAPPLLRGDFLYVLNKAGDLYKVDPDVFATPVWTLHVLDGVAQAVGELAFQADTTVNYLYLTDTSGKLTYVADQGDTAVVIGSTILGGRLATSGPLVVSSLNRLYVGTQGAPGLVQLGLCSPSSFVVAGDALNGTCTRLVADMSNTATARLLAATSVVRLSRYCIPWGSSAVCLTNPPTVTVLAPAGGEVVPVGANVTLQWTTSVPASVPAVDVLLSRSGYAGPFVAIAMGMANTGSLSWTASGPATESAAFQVVAHTTDNTIAGAANSGYFAIRSLSNTIDRCDLESPSLLSAVTGTTTALVFGRVYKAGLTVAAGAPLGVTAELGYGPDGSDPSAGAGWTWVTAAYSAQQDSSDEYVGSFLAPAAGVYDYAYRFRFLAGPLLHGDLDGSANGYSPGSAGYLFVAQTTDVGTGGPNPNMLLGAAPNPFDPATRITFTLASPGRVEISIYGLNGQRVRSVLQGTFEAGSSSALWDGRDDQGVRVAPGVYYARFSTRDRVKSLRLVLLK